MKKARIAELKNRLSYYLRFVRRGQPVLIYDRDRIIARIEPVGFGPAGVGEPAAEPDQGCLLRPPSAGFPEGWRKERVAASADIVAALLEERESGR